MRLPLLISLFLCFFAVQTALHAQRIADEKATVRFNRPPNKLLPLEYTTYSVGFSSPTGDMAQAGLVPNRLIHDYYTLRAFRRLENGGHFHISTEYGPLNILSIEDQSVEKTTKNKKGEEVTSTSFYRMINYRMTSSLQIFDANQAILFEKIINTPTQGETFLFKSRGKRNFSTMRHLESAWEDEQQAVENQLRASFINKVTKEYAELIRNQFDTREISTHIELQVPKGRKVANADEFEQFTQQAIDIFATMQAHRPVAPLREPMQPVLDFWEAQVAAYDATQKNTAKIHHACLYNLVVVNFQLENFDAAEQYLQACQALDVKKGLTNSLSRTIRDTRAMMERYQLQSRHYDFQLANAQGPVGVDYSYLYPSAPPPTAAATPYSIPGYLISSRGDSLTGNFIISGSSTDELRYYKGGNTSFVYFNKGQTHTILLDPSLFRRASFNGRTFLSKPFSEAVSLRKRNNILEYIAGGERMQLYYYHPFYNELTGNLVLRKGNENPIDLDLDNLRFVNWKKGFASLFEDCPSLKTAIEAGTYRRNKGAIVRAVDVYNAGDCK